MHVVDARRAEMQGNSHAACSSSGKSVLVKWACGDIGTVRAKLMPSLFSASFSSQHHIRSGGDTRESEERGGDRQRAQRVRVGACSIFEFLREAGRHAKYSDS